MSALIPKSPRPSRRTSYAAFADAAPDADDPFLGFAPYVHAAPRRNSITPERQRAFIAALAASGIVTQAARESGASLEALYKLRHRQGAGGFSAAWEAAIDRAMMRLEDCAPGAGAARRGTAHRLGRGKCSALIASTTSAISASC